MNEQQNPNPYAPPVVRQLTRVPDEGMVAGVCAGFARYAGLDPTLVRVLAVVALFVGFPAVLVGYLVAWAIMPRA
jgi:phage shock protein PspC (stress-responsive transcriptional regulator)